MTTDVDALRITSGSVRIESPVVTGIGADSGGTAHAVSALGTPTAPIRDVRVTGGRLEHVPHDGVHAEYVDGLTVSGTTMSVLGYAGVAGTGIDGARVEDTRIADVRQPAGRVNSYGITFTRDATRPIDQTRRSTDVTIVRNHVSDVPAWEGIDVHAASTVTIAENRVSGCRVGIAAVPSKDDRDRTQTSAAPLGLRIQDNDVRRGTGLTAGSGILVSGAGTTVGSTRERATGSVTGNRITGAGGDDEAGVLVKLSRGFTVADNDIRTSDGRAITLPHSNDRITLSGNRVHGVSGVRIGIDVGDGANSGVIRGTVFDVQDPALRTAVRLPRSGGPSVSSSSWGNARVRLGRG
jgi:hypothetical protein